MNSAHGFQGMFFFCYSHVLQVSQNTDAFWENSLLILLGKVIVEEVVSSVDVSHNFFPAISGNWSFRKEF